jgi:flagellar basal-body rod protein FlgF
MSGGIYVALSGAVAQTTQLDTTAANIANANTDGYQRVRPVFREMLAQASGSANGTGGGGALTVTSALDTSRGTLRNTGNALDVALPDSSYLTVSTPRGDRFTRAGSLTTATDGTLTTKSHAPVLGEDGNPIKTVPANGPVSISPAGEVFQKGAKVGQMKIVQFANPSAMNPEGGSILAATAASGAATPSKGQLEVGAVEESNTSVIGAMSDLVNASRTFDAFQRAIDTFREADQKIVTVPGDT